MFNCPIDYHKARLTVCTKPLQGKMVSIQRLAVSTAIQVHNIGTQSEEALQLYFENRKSGGGDVVRVEMYPDKGFAIVHFADKQGICIVYYVDV